MMFVFAKLIKNVKNFEIILKNFTVAAGLVRLVSNDIFCAMYVAATNRAT